MAQQDHHISPSPPPRPRALPVSIDEPTTTGAISPDAPRQAPPSPLMIMEPNPGEEDLFRVEDNPFGVTPGHLSRLVEPKSVAVLRQLGGLAGLGRALRTDLRAGLSVDETRVSPRGRLSASGIAAAADATAGQGASHHHGAPSFIPLANKQHDDGDDARYADRRRVFGENRLPERKGRSFLALAWIALQDRVLILLSVAAAVSLALGLYQTFDGRSSHHEDEEGGGGRGARVEWIEGVAIIAAILVVVVVGALNDWQKERRFRQLNRKKEDREVTVVRSGRPARVSVYDVLVGDVMVLEQGDVVPVDGVLVDGHNVCCDESSSTGESDVVRKTPAEDVLERTAALPLREDDPAARRLDPFLLSGARVLDGVGTFLVTAVGPHSSMGRTMMALRDDPGLTPLQARLGVLAGYIAKLGSAAGLLLFSVLFIEFLARLPGNPETSEEKGQDFLQILITAITIIVVAIPEGLPLAVTLSLAFATKKMTRENNLVRHLQSCETMGNATVICSDKTGTLTQNVMTVVAGALGLGPRAVAFGGGGSSGGGDGIGPGELPAASLASALHPDLRELVTQSVAANTTAFEGEDTNTTTTTATRSSNRTTTTAGSSRSPFIGTKTETALLDWARRALGLGPLAEERARYPLAQVYPFSSQRKCMGSVVVLPWPDGDNSNKDNKPSKKYRLLVKGAPEVVLARCARAVADPADSSSFALLEEADRGVLDGTVARYAARSLRTLALAYRDFDEWPPPASSPLPLPLPSEEGNGKEAHGVEEEGGENSTEEDPAADVMRDLTWIGVVAIQDPVRAGVPAAVRDCRRASVAVKMVTGDKLETARAVARECGILPEADDDDEEEQEEEGENRGEDGGRGGRRRVMEGADFRRLNETQRRAAGRELCVLARSSPDDKRALVSSLRALGEVVAVTGDGTNDAPALKAADVGFSMGQMGTEVAKEASDIVLMDDDFSSLVRALAWGRAVNDAVKKFLQFQLTVNIAAVVLTFASAVASPDERSVINAIQLLWVNLIMDTFAALALATDPPTPSLLDRAPEPRDAPLVTLTMWKMILGQAAYQLAVCLTLHFAGPAFLPYPDAQRRTLVFNTFVMMQIFKLVNSRRIDNRLNILEGLSRNHLFVLMFVIMAAGQVLIVFFGGAAFVVVRLTAAQWAISLVLGVMSIPVGILIRLVPDRWVAACARRLTGLLAPLRCGRKRRWGRGRGRRGRAADEEAADGGRGRDAASRDLGSAMFAIRDDLEFLKRVRGGRMAALSGVVASRSRSRQPVGRKRGDRSTSPMRSAMGMPGLLAASIGAMSPVASRESGQCRQTPNEMV